MRAIIPFLAALVVGAGFAAWPDDPAPTTRRDAANATVTSRRTRTTTPPSSTDPPATTTPPAETTGSVPPPPSSPPATPIEGALCIGDSVMLGAANLGALTMCGVVDAPISRQVAEGPAVVQGYAPFPDVVILHLGTNGTANAADLDAMLSALQGVPRVVLVTAQLNGLRSWEGQVNDELRALAGRYPNVRLADWKAASDGHPEYFTPDGFHPSAEGARVYADAIRAAG